MVRIGAVHRQIAKLAEERNVDVIVMESTNPKVQDHLLGTTASHVVTHANCSVSTWCGDNRTPAELSPQPKTPAWAGVIISEQPSQSFRYSALSASHRQ